MKSYLGTLFIAFTAFLGFEAHALSTAASFDLSYGITNLSIESFDATGTTQLKSRTLSSSTVGQIDYNVALFDYRTVATLSFTQTFNSNLGTFPLTRIGLGASYHFIRVNGQRVILDNQVEAKIWGISPAVELTFGLAVLSIRDPADPNTDFTASMIDFSPKLLLEIPVSSSLLVVFRGGLLQKILGGGDFKVYYAGSIFTLGLKLTTL